MLRIVALIVALTGPVCVVQAETSPAPRPLASALHAMQSGNWQRALQLAARDGKNAESLIEWYRLRAGKGSADEVERFLNEHGHWPGLKLLRKRSEEEISGAPDEIVLKFFQTDVPQTGQGILSYARALRSGGRSDEADAALIRAWTTLGLSNEEHAAFLKQHVELLKKHHVTRLDMVLWRGMVSDAQRMAALVSEDYSKLAAARLGLRRRVKNVDSLIAAVPENLRNDPGLAYERFLWRVRKGRTEDAVALILEKSEETGGLGIPERWASWRRSLARGQMRQGNIDTAYQLAVSHGLTQGSHFADLEWLAGYISLHYLNDPQQALRHFERFRAAVFTPISLGRAGYWIGRAQEAAGDTEAALAAYRAGAAHQTSFYGLLAAEIAGEPFDAALKGTEYFPAWQEAAFASSDLVEIIQLALAAGELSLAERFMSHLAEGLERKELGQLGNMVTDLGAPHLAVMLGKQAARRGIVLSGHYYALHPLAKMNLPVTHEMALSIARRESEFDPVVVSGAGAQGLMQLMPATARQVAKGLELDHDPVRVLSDWRYNATLGSAYLAEQAEKFAGNVIMVSAAYNAGPGRPVKWMNSFGDPRIGERDIVDWIEHIPFRETRNYVMRVAESMPVYRARLGKPALPVPFSRELIGASVKE